MRCVGVATTALVMTCWMSIVGPAFAAPGPEFLNKEGGELAKKTFSATAGASTLETKAGEKVKCSESKASGEIIGTQGDKTTVTLSGCEAFGFKCNSVGAGAGKIVLALTGETVYVGTEGEKAGLLQQVTEVTIECSAFQKLKLHGSAIGVLTPINQLVTPPEVFTLAFGQTKGVQEPSEYENEKGEHIKATFEVKGEGLKTFGFEAAGLASTESLLFTEAAVVEEKTPPKFTVTNAVFKNPLPNTQMVTITNEGRRARSVTSIAFGNLMGVGKLKPNNAQVKACEKSIPGKPAAPANKCTFSIELEAGATKPFSATTEVTVWRNNLFTGTLTY